MNVTDYIYDYNVDNRAESPIFGCNFITVLQRGFYKCRFIFTQSCCLIIIESKQPFIASGKKKKKNTLTRTVKLQTLKLNQCGRLKCRTEYIVNKEMKRLIV